ncbi:MAG: superoxide dismutase family protein [bacterium]
MTSAARWFIAGAAVLGLVASASAQEVATGVFKNAEGKDVGTVRIEHIASSTLFLLKLHDLPPGTHGIHIHSVGQCTPPTFDSAGPHWNPLGKKHGKDNADGPHAGDLTNIVIPASGKLETQFNLEGMTLVGEGNLLDGDGGSIVIHAGQDDYKTDPSGNSGARIACAVLGIDQRQE